MARKVNVSEEAAVETVPEPLAPSAEVGGSPGVIQDASTIVHHPGRPTATAMHAVSEDALKAKEYRVMGDKMVVLDMTRIVMKAGKIVSDTAFDIEALKRQGVVLQEVG